MARLFSLGGKRMTKTVRDFISFMVMAALIFAVISLSFTSVTGSSGAGIRYLHLHWIVVRQDIWHTSVSHIYTGTLAALIALSVCLSWALLELLKILRAKRSATGWLLFVLVIVVYLGLAMIPNYVLS